jgi:hypothetical protein
LILPEISLISHSNSQKKETMKKTLVLVLLFLSAAGFGQKTFYFGLGGYYGASGVVNQNDYGLPELDYEVPSSYGYNANLGYCFTKNIGIKMEIGYARLGQKYSDTRDSVFYTRDVKLGYLTVPVLFKYNTGGKTARFYLLAGPQMGFLMSAKQEYMADGVPFDTTLSNLNGEAFNAGQEDIKDRFSSFELMARIDLGVDITLVENLVLNVGLTMNYGLLDLNAEAYRLNDYSGNYTPSHNFYGGINMGIVYCLPLQK